MRLYHGFENINTPVRMGRRMAAKLKGAVSKEYEGELHMTLFDNYREDISRDIVKH